MSKLAFGRHDLRAAYLEFRRLLDDAGPRQDDRHAREALLCGLYAVECGLKALLLARRQVATTAALDEDDDAFTHDPNRLLKLLGQPCHFPHFMDACRPKLPQVAVVRYQELVRYGGLFSVPDERRFVDALHEAMKFIKENL